MQKNDSFEKIKEIMADNPNIRIGELLEKAGLVDSKTIQQALELQKSNHKKIGEIFVDMGIIDQKFVDKVAYIQTGIETVYLNELNLNSNDPMYKIIPSQLARQLTVVPIEKTDSTLTVAMTNAKDEQAINILKEKTGLDIKTKFAKNEDIHKKIDELYPKKNIVLYEVTPDKKAHHDKSSKDKSFTLT